MYKKLSTLFIAALLISNFSFAKIFRVGYSGPQLSGVDFIDANTAVTAASTNDTIQIYPGISTGVNPLSKKLVFIGMGYFLDKNSNLQVATTSATLGVQMDNGANGSVFEGLEITGGGGYFNLTGNIVRNILFKRCKITSGAYGFNLATPGDSVVNVIFAQCYFTSYIALYVADNTKVSGIDFQNCIFESSYPFLPSVSGSGIIANISLENCNGNVYVDPGSTGATGFYYRNCIFRYEPTAPNNNIFDYCTFESNNATHYVAGTANQYGKDFLTVFSGDVSSGTQWDATWTLKSGSPAIGYGRDFSNNPIDAGAYGSINPYKLSGIPPIPAFYKLTAPSSNASSNPYTITFSVRANN